MATTTPVLGLRQPAGTDYVAVLQDISNNMGIIDTAIGNIKNVVDPQGALPNNTDLNDVTTPGVYFISGSRTYINAPSGYGILEVIVGTNSGYLTQRVTTTYGIYVRYKSDSWYDWNEIGVSKTTFARINNLTIVDNGTTSVDISAYRPSTDYSLYFVGVLVQSGNKFYQLPWFDNNNARAIFVQDTTNTSFTIRNNGTNWGTTTIYVTMIWKHN